jgi:hypothetical protein
MGLVDGSVRCRGCVSDTTQVDSRGREGGAYQGGAISLVLDPGPGCARGGLYPRMQPARRPIGIRARVQELGHARRMPSGGLKGRHRPAQSSIC